MFRIKNTYTGEYEPEVYTKYSSAERAITDCYRDFASVPGNLETKFFSMEIEEMEEDYE